MRKIMTTEEKQLASLDILDYFHRFCVANNIKYYLAYGTLLGAIRHKGFIPWDDDVDVHIPRPDYEKVLDLFNDPAGQFDLITCDNNDDYMLPYAKIQNMKTARCLENGTLDSQGIGIDLFPLDGVPNDLSQAKDVFKKENDKFIRIVQRADHYRMIKPKNPFELAKKIYGVFFYLTGVLKKTGREISKNPYNTNYEDCEYVAAVVGIHSGRFIPFMKSDFDLIDVEFCGKRFKAPKKYDQILTKIYGNYMELPPVEKRTSTHSDKFVWKNNC